MRRVVRFWLCRLTKQRWVQGCCDEWPLVVENIDERDWAPREEEERGQESRQERKPHIHDDAAFKVEEFSEVVMEEISGHVHGSYSSVTSHIHPTPPARAA
jgi:hypothetical protein